MPSAPDARLERLVALRNVGPKSAGWMIEVGVDSPERLAELGAVEAYRRIKAAYPRQISLCALWALQGALMDVPYTQLPVVLRDALRAALADAAGRAPDPPR